MNRAVATKLMMHPNLGAGLDPLDVDDLAALHHPGCDAVPDCRRELQHVRTGDRREVVRLKHLLAHLHELQARAVEPTRHVALNQATSYQCSEQAKGRRLAQAGPPGSDGEADAARLADDNVKHGQCPKHSAGDVVSLVHARLPSVQKAFIL